MFALDLVNMSLQKELSVQKVSALININLPKHKPCDGGYNKRRTAAKSAIRTTLIQLDFRHTILSLHLPKWSLNDFKDQFENFCLFHTHK